MAITVNTMRLTNSNAGYAPIPAGGASATAGTAENFEFLFPARDETICIIVANGSTAAVTAKLAAPPQVKGSAPGTLNLPAGKLGVFRVESGFVKAPDGKITLTLTPGATYTLTELGVRVYGIYSGVPTR